jgi:hypothetical protein
VLATAAPRLLLVVPISSAISKNGAVGETMMKHSPTRVRLLNTSGGVRTFAVVFRTGDDPVEGLHD